MVKRSIAIIYPSPEMAVVPSLMATVQTLADAGYEVDLYLCRPGNYPEPTFNSNRVQIFWFPQHHSSVGRPSLGGSTSPAWIPMVFHYQIDWDDRLYTWIRYVPGGGFGGCKFCCRIMEHSNIPSLDNVLHKYRGTPHSISVARLAEQDAYHSLARECALQRQIGLPEDLPKMEQSPEVPNYSLGYVQRLRTHRVMAGNCLTWGCTLLARNQVSAARRELFFAMRTFPFDGHT